MHSIINKAGLFFLCISIGMCNSCKKFLATNSQNMSFVNSAKDLNEILLGEAYFDINNDISTNLFHLSDDDIDLGYRKSGQELNFDFGLFYWQEEPRIGYMGNVVTSDPFYNNMYAKIARLNTILHEVEKLRKKGEPEDLLIKVSGEAHFLRAYYYFKLVNLYGKPYKRSTAHLDFGVPLKIDPAISEQFLSRRSVKSVYDQVVFDLEKADQLLGKQSAFSVIRASWYAAVGLLSRVYLYKEEYEKSIHYANRILESQKFELIDLNTLPATSQFLHKDVTEVIFSMGFNEMGMRMAIDLDAPIYHYFVASDELYNSYQLNDLRKSKLFSFNALGSVRTIKKGNLRYPNISDVSDKFSIRLAELYLNKAEALAALGREDEALTTIRFFQQYRFDGYNIPDWQYIGAELVNQIREERRKELCFEGHRWFDLRRYGVNSKFPFGKSIKHRSLQKTGDSYIVNGYYELGPYAQDEAAYTYPIASDEVDFNEGRIANEGRSVRELKN